MLYFIGGLPHIYKYVAKNNSVVPLEIIELINNGEYYILITQCSLNIIDAFCDLNNRSLAHREYMKIMTSIYFNRHLRFDKDSVSIPARYLAKLFSSNYNRIKKDCLNTTLNFRKKFNVAKGRCNSYSLKTEAKEGEIIKYFPKVSSRFINKIKALEIDDYGRGYDEDLIYGDSRILIQNQFLLQVRNYYTLDKINPILLRLLEENKISKKTYCKNIDLIEGFEKNGKYYTKSADANGRLYNVLSLTKRECRSVLANEYCEIDISNSHPFLMGAILNFLLENNFKKINRENNFIGILKNQMVLSQIHKEDYVLKNIFCGEGLNISNFKLMGFVNNKIESIGFDNQLLNSNNQLLSIVILSSINQLLNYNHISNTYHFNVWELQSEIEKFHLDTKNGGFYMKLIQDKELEMSLFRKYISLAGSSFTDFNSKNVSIQIREKIIKTSFMYWMNAVKSKESVFFRILYPNISKLLFFLKERYGKTALHTLITTVESNLIFKIISICNSRTNKSRPFLAGSLHDALFVPSNKVDIVTEVIDMQGDKMFNSPIPYKIKSL